MTIQNIMKMIVGFIKLLQPTILAYTYFIWFRNVFLIFSDYAEKKNKVMESGFSFAAFLAVEEIKRI